MVVHLLRIAACFGLWLLIGFTVPDARAGGILAPQSLFPQFSWGSAPPQILKPLAPPRALPAYNRAADNPPRLEAEAAAPFAACAAAIQQAQAVAGTPNGLLHAIAMVESGRRNPSTGQVAPWPWTIDADGAGHFYATESRAIAAVRQLQAQGIRAIDVGCMQIDLAAHPNAFATLHQAFDPLTNALYGAHFLLWLHGSLGHWAAAIGGYHSLNPDLGTPYYQKVAMIWQHQAPSILYAQRTLYAPRAAKLVLAKAKTSPLRKPEPHPGAIIAPQGFGAGSFQFSAPPPEIIAARSGGMSLAAYRARPVLIASAR